MNIDKNSLRPEDLTALPSQQLDELLRAELEKDDKDAEKVLQILHILEERESGKFVNNMDTESIWNAYQEGVRKDALINAQRDRKPRRWIGRLIAAAAILCILITAAPKAMGAENLFEILGRWTKTIFAFFDPSSATEPPEEYVFKTDHPGLQRIYDAVAEQGVTKPVVPTWVPDGYELGGVKVTPKPLSRKIYAWLSNGDSVITIAFEIYNENRSNQYTKDEVNVEMYEKEGVKHYFMPNEGNWQAVWVNENVECGILTDCERDVLYNIIKSIYKGD